jgi:hypothetical protein
MSQSSVCFTCAHLPTQSAAVSGAINITCDAWQATNTDGYFAVTGHWIEEKSTMQWECESALLGFTQFNNAHNGKCLGGALFKVLDHIGITHKACHLCILLGLV